MRKLKKTCNLSTVYKDWEEDLKNNNKEHPKYNSTKGEFYTDIFTNLLNIQNGLCAYTEISLCDPDKLTKEKWNNGHFHKQKFSVKPFCSDGALDHFNPDFKNEKAWLWDNFFLIGRNNPLFFPEGAYLCRAGRGRRVRCHKFSSWRYLG